MSSDLINRYLDLRNIRTNQDDLIKIKDFRLLDSDHLWLGSHINFKAVRVGFPVRVEFELLCFNSDDGDGYRGK